MANENDKQPIATKIENAGQSIQLEEVAAAWQQAQDFKEPNKIKELTGLAKVTFVVGYYSEFWGYKKFPKQSLFRAITVENLEQILTAWFSFPDFRPFQD